MYYIIDTLCVCVCVCVCLCRLVELAAQSIKQEFERGKSQEDSWNGSTIDLVRASDVSSWIDSN